MDSRFYRDSYGNGPGLSIRDVYRDEGRYLHVDRINPGGSHPFHISGKYGSLGWSNFQP